MRNTNRKFPSPLKAQIIKYGRNKGTDYKDPALNTAEKRMLSAMDSIEGNLNHLSEALKHRFKALLVSQLSLLRYKDLNNKNIPSSREIGGSVERATNSGELIYMKRCDIQSSHTEVSSREVSCYRTLATDKLGTQGILNDETKICTCTLQSENRIPPIEYVSCTSTSAHRKRSPCLNSFTDYRDVSQTDIPHVSVHPTAYCKPKQKHIDSEKGKPSIRTSRVRCRSPQSPPRILTNSYFSDESAVVNKVANKPDIAAVRGKHDIREIGRSPFSNVNNLEAATGARLKTPVHGQFTATCGSAKTFSPSCSKIPQSVQQQLDRGGGIPKSPKRVSLSAQLNERKTESIISDLSNTHRNAKLRHRTRTKSISLKGISPNRRCVSSNVDRNVLPTYDPPKGAYIELSQHSLDADFIVPKVLLNETSNENGQPKFHQSPLNIVKACKTIDKRHIKSEDVHITNTRIEQVGTSVDARRIKSYVNNSEVGSKPSVPTKPKKTPGGKHQIGIYDTGIDSKPVRHITHESIQNLPSPHTIRGTAKQQNRNTQLPNKLEERLDLQLKKKLLLNAIRTLICVTHHAVQRMVEEDFDVGIWNAISKNVSGVEAELEEFSANFVCDEILPPETAVKEAEDRLKTRLGVLFSLNYGRKRFQASEATRQDIMENVELLKATSFRHGVYTQNEMLLGEMKHVVMEIKNLAEVFQVCGERFSKRLKGDINQFHSLGKGNGLSLFLRSCFLGGATSDEDRIGDDNNHCIRRSSSLDALADMCSDVFGRMSDVQKALIILVFVGLAVYLVTEFLSGACGTIRTVGDMWNNLFILRYGPPTV